MVKPMKKELLNEINRVLEIMDLELLEQRKVVRTLPDKDVFAGNTLVPIKFPDNIVLPIAPGNESITDVSQVQMKNMLPSLKEFIIKLKKNLAADYTPVSMSIDSGASPTPANRAVPRGYSQEQVDFSYGDEEPDNKILARKRGTVILELLNRIIPRKWGGEYKNLDNERIIKNWQELSKLIKTNPQTKSTKFVSINVEGSKKVKGSAIYGCGKKLNVVGEQGDENNNWISQLKPQKDAKVQLDAEGYLNLGKNTEGKITLVFDPMVVPDAFKVTYNDEVQYVPFTTQQPEKMDDAFVRVPFTNKENEDKIAYIELAQIYPLLDTRNEAWDNVDVVSEQIMSTVPSEATDLILSYLQKKKPNKKKVQAWEWCAINGKLGMQKYETPAAWLKGVYKLGSGWVSNLLRELGEMNVNVEGCQNYKAATDLRNKTHSKLTKNKEFKKAQKREIIRWDKENRAFLWDDEKLQELGAGSYNERLALAAEDVTDPKIKELLLQGVVGKPQGVTLDKIYGVPKVKIEAIAPLGGTKFTISLKCKSGEG